MVMKRTWTEPVASVIALVFGWIGETAAIVHFLYCMVDSFIILINVS